MVLLLFMHVFSYFQSGVGGSGNAALKERIELLETMCKYCGDKMESYLSESNVD